MEDGSFEARIQLKRRFADFLEREFIMPEDAFWTYTKGLADLYTTNGEGKAVLITRRLMVHEHHLREFDEPLLNRLLAHPTDCLPAFEDALRELIQSGVDTTLQKLLESTQSDLHIGLRGDFGRHEVSPRELSSERLGQMVVLFGIVTKCSLVRPKIVRSVHYCETTKEFTTKEYRDVTALTGLPTGAQYPTKDDAGNLLTTEFGLCKYIDNQMIGVQELPETAPPGQLPHSAEVVLEDDLVDHVKPGDRVSIVGVYKAVAGKVSGLTSGVFRAVVVGVSVHKLTKESQIKHTIEEARQIRQLAERPDVLSVLASSLAPSIYGHDIIKRGLILQLFGGLEKNLANGAHLRGDVNCLLVGDPGVAKSQLLRAAMNISPHAISTTGRGSSGVGLTAAVTTDNQTGEKRLEAGAMVLADRGLVCIDEFDKMSDQDRVAIHEVMEQQTVTIAKAGIFTSLNARCSVLAAANPLYGSYDKSITVTRNVNLPDSLLSRFDMLFVVLDQMNDARDRQLAAHVIRQHRYRPPGEDGMSAPAQESIHDRRLSLDSETSAGPKVFMKHDYRLHGLAPTSGQPQDVLTSNFLRKYVIFARRRYSKEGVKINFEEEAAEAIVDYYSELRKQSHDRALPVTARTLETMIRLATASCKVRLRFTIDLHDVAVARAILDHVLKKNVGDEDTDGDADEDPTAALQPGNREDQEEDSQPGPRGRKRGRGSRHGRGASHQNQDDVGDQAGAGKRDDDGDSEDDDDDGNDMGGGGEGAATTRGATATRPSATTDMDIDGNEPGPSTRSGGGRGAAKRQATESTMRSLGLSLASSTPQPKVQKVPASGALSEAQKQLVIDTVRTCIDEIEGFIPIDELQMRLKEQSLMVSEEVLAKFLQWCMENYDSRPHVGKVPAIMWDPDNKTFFSCL